MASRGHRLGVSLGAAIVAVAALLLLLWRSAPGPREPRAGPEPRPRQAPSARPVLRFDRPVPVRPSVPSPAADEPARAALEGRVISSETGAGIAGAELTFSRADAAAGVRSGSDGAFRFEAPADGRWRLAAVTAPGFLPFAPEWEHSPVAFEATAPVGGVEIRLTPATALVVRVLDPDGRPVAGAAVRIVGAGDEAALVSLPDRFISDEAGEVRLSAPGGAHVEARKPGFAPGRATIDLVARAERRLALRLGRDGPEGEPAWISGRVVERGGSAVPGALVVAERVPGRRASRAAMAQAVTRADGAFAVGPLDPGRYRLVARAEGRAGAVAEWLAPGAEGVTLELSPGARLRGCVRDAASGAPVTAFTVVVSERQGPLLRSGARARSFLAASGCWALDDLAPGPVAVAVAAPGFAPSGEIPAEVPDAGEAIADATVAREGRLSGVIVDAETRSPIAGARLAVEGAAHAGASVFPVVAESVTDAQGRFALGGLPDRFSIAVAAAGHHVRVVSGAAERDDDPAPVVIALRRAAPGEERRRDFGGIGVAVAPSGEALVVTSVLPGGGAAEAGVARGDAIVGVDGVPVTALGLARAVDAIRGPEGTFVLLHVRRDESTFEVRIARAVVRG
jgi:hypothetical protein